MCSETASTCDICSNTGQSLQSRRVSFTHILQALNERLQADYMFKDLRRNRRCILHMFNNKTRFSNSAIVIKRTWTKMPSLLNLTWISRHQVPKKGLVDREFTKASMPRFLNRHRISEAKILVRRYNKTRVIEHKHRTVKTILENLQTDSSSDLFNIILPKRGTFLLNIFTGPSSTSFFALV